MSFVQIWHSRGVGATWKQIGDWRLNCSAPIRTRPRHQSECVGATTYSPAVLGFCGAGLTWSFISARQRDEFFMSTHICSSGPPMCINIFFRLLSRRKLCLEKLKAERLLIEIFALCWWDVFIGPKIWCNYILDMKLGAGESYWKFALPSYQSISRRVNAG